MFVSPNEVDKLQDWVDENSVEFIGEIRHVNLSVTSIS